MVRFISPLNIFRILRVRPPSRFDECVIPKENLVGTENKAVWCMMRNLEIERVALAAMSLGIARRSIEVSVRGVWRWYIFGPTFTFDFCFLFFVVFAFFVSTL